MLHFRKELCTDFFSAKLIDKNLRQRSIRPIQLLCVIGSRHEVEGALDLRGELIDVASVHALNLAARVEDDATRNVGSERRRLKGGPTAPAVADDPDLFRALGLDISEELFELRLD